MIVIYLLQELYLHFWLQYDLQTWFADVAGHSFDILRNLRTSFTVICQLI